jgi:SOS response regulatory protein OraA/RecX
VSESILKEYFTEEKEQEAATTLATRKLKSSRSRLSSLDVATLQKRLIDYLLSRGFSREIANKTVRSIVQ